MRCKICNEGMAGAIPRDQLCMDCQKLKAQVGKAPAQALLIIQKYHNDILTGWFRKVMRKI